jgi:hypothetical protein
MREDKCGSALMLIWVALVKTEALEAQRVELVSASEAE